MINNYVPIPGSGSSTVVIFMMIINYLYMAVDAAHLVSVTILTITELMAKLLPHQLVRMDHTESFL